MSADERPQARSAESSPASALLAVDDLRVEARAPDGGWTPIVKKVRFDVRRREVVALIGESGSGKTTTCLAAVGYSRAGCRIASGRVSFDNIDVLSLDHEHRRRLRGVRIAYVAQSAAAAFNPALTIGEQVTEGPRVHGVMSSDEAVRRAIRLFAQLDLPDPERIGRRYPHQLSGGQLQRLMAAMALICGPDLLLLDEPTTALDVTTQIEVLKALKQVVQQYGAAAIYVSHDLAVVAQIADRIVVLRDGIVVEQGVTAQILGAPGHEYTKRLIAAVRPRPRASRAASSQVEADESGSTPLLELVGVSAWYGKSRQRPVLCDVDLALPRGATVGVIGESGSGKSTLARVIAGLMSGVSGRLLCNGKAFATSVERRRRDDLGRIQLVFQMADVALNPRQRVRDALRRPLELFGNVEAGRSQSRIHEMLERVELAPSVADLFPGELSGGQKQRVNLARALIAEPEVLLCDEVTSSLDTLVAAAIIDLLKRIQAELHVACLFISHDISTIASLASSVVVLYAGRVVEQGPLGLVLGPPHHPYTRLLLNSVPELRAGWLDAVPSQPAQEIGANAGNEGAGCPFRRRCVLAIEGTCDRKPPPERRLPGGHRIVCHRDPAELVYE
jgi:peptide/nickel transport system ATP-binding protein